MPASALPSFCSALNFLFDAAFPPLDCKPILALCLPLNPSTSASHPDDNAETAIQACPCPNAGVLAFKATLPPDCVGHHNFERFRNLSLGSRCVALPSMETPTRCLKNAWCSSLFSQQPVSALGALIVRMTEICFASSRSSCANSQEKSTHACGAVSKIVTMRPLK